MNDWKELSSYEALEEVRKKSKDRDSKQKRNPLNYTGILYIVDIEVRKARDLNRAEHFAMTHGIANVMERDLKPVVRGYIRDYIKEKLTPDDKDSKGN